MPGACQSHAVTEPQREKTRLKLDKPPQKGLMYQDFQAKLYFECFQNTRRISAVKKVKDFFDKLMSVQPPLCAERKAGENAPCAASVLPLMDAAAPAGMTLTPEYAAPGASCTAL